MFEDPFWVGVFERSIDGKYEAARFVFGAEPCDGEVYELIKKGYYNLNYTREFNFEEKAVSKINPKRLQREINRELSSNRVSTKSQLALAAELEARKIERKAISKEQREEAIKLKYEKRKLVKKEKKRGR